MCGPGPVASGLVQVRASHALHARTSRGRRLCCLLPLSLTCLSPLNPTSPPPPLSLSHPRFTDHHNPTTRYYHDHHDHEPHRLPDLYLPNPKTQPPSDPSSPLTCPFLFTKKQKRSLSTMSFRSSTRTALKQALQAATSANSKRSFSLVAKAAVRPQVARTAISVSLGFSLLMASLWSSSIVFAR